MSDGTASMKDVASAAGVSVGTVSNVLNRPDIVSPDRRSRVEAAIQRLGYVRNDAARQLKMGRSRTVGAVVLDATNPFYADLVAGMETAGEEAGLAVIAGSSGHRPERERLYLSLFEEQRMRGILLATAGGNADRVEEIRRRGTPVVLVEDSTTQGPFSSVGIDDVAGADLAVTHLCQTGRRRIAVVVARRDLHQVRDRLTGARRAAERAEVRLEVVQAADLTVLAGRAVGQSLLARQAGERPDGVFCVNDLLAVGALQAFAFLHQVEVPEEIALIGYDDIAFAQSTVVPLTSVAQPAALMGRTALELLEEQIAGGPESVRHVRFTPELRVRDSTVGPSV